MGWELTGKPLTTRVTHKLAKEFAELEAAHTDRPLSERRLNVYRRVLDEGGFRPVTWARAWCVETEQWYRVNGKHTSTLFASVDAAKLADVYAVVEMYRCDTLEDVAKLYATFDSQTQTRNAGDVNRSFAAVIPELKDFDVRTVNLFVGALNYARFPAACGGGGGPTRDGSLPGAPTTAAERAEILFDCVDECLWLHGLLGDMGRHRHLCRIPVAAAAVGCWRKAKKDAGEFWAAVRDETGERPDLPDRKLARWLLQHHVKHGVGAASGPARYRVLPREFYVRCVHAWNAWRRKEKTELRYFPAAKIPAFQ